MLGCAPQLAPVQVAPNVETTRLHVDAPSSTKVFGRPSPDAEWTLVCTAACEAQVPRSWQYRLEATGVLSPAPFHLDATANRTVVVHVDPAYTAWWVGGTLAVIGGIATVLIGLPAVAIADSTCLPPTQPGAGPPCGVAIGIVLGVGAALIAGGTVAVVNNASTTVTQDDGTQAPASATPSSGPVWIARRDPRAGAVTFGAPVLTLRF